jgi:hypothetical protein
LQDDTQRPEQAPAPGQPASPPPTTPPAQPPAQPTESTVSPRGLEHLRSESTTFSQSLGLTPEHEEHPFHGGLDTSLPYGYEHQEPMYLPLALSVGAGFKFGCGFMLAVGISLFGLFLAASVIFFVAALAGVPLPGASP